MVTQNSFETIKAKDILLHYPYHSFDHITELVRQASFDPESHQHKINVYRVAKDSRLMNSLNRQRGSSVNEGCGGRTASAFWRRSQYWMVTNSDRSWRTLSLVPQGWRFTPSCCLLHVKKTTTLSVTRISVQVASTRNSPYLYTSLCWPPMRSWQRKFAVFSTTLKTHSVRLSLTIWLSHRETREPVYTVW